MTSGRPIGQEGLPKYRVTSPLKFYKPITQKLYNVGQ